VSWHQFIEVASLFIDIAQESLPPFGLSVCPVQAQAASADRGSLGGRFGKAKTSMVSSALTNSALEAAHIKSRRTNKIDGIVFRPFKTYLDGDKNED